MQQAILAIADLAMRYCRVIEGSRSDSGAWLAEVAELLPRLHAAVCSVDCRDQFGALLVKPDLDERFELYTHLARLLGERDGYWLEFDGFDETQTMTGSLADDLTDIYCELKGGLALLATDPHSAVYSWRIGYDRHWGQHLVDAERHLAKLSAQGHLQ